VRRLAVQIYINFTITLHLQNCLLRFQTAIAIRALTLTLIYTSKTVSRSKRPLAGGYSGPSPLTVAECVIW